MRTALLVTCDLSDADAAALAESADALVFDLAGASSTRPARRAAALAALLRTAALPTPPQRIVRLAELPSGLVDADLDIVMAGAPDAVLLPRVVGAASIEQLGAKLAVREAERALPAGRTRIVAVPADTGAGLLALPRLAQARSRLAALLWDPVALATDLGADPGGEPCRIARTMVLATAAACGVPAWEATPDEGDVPLARRDEAARRDGFAGLLLFRPSRLLVVRGSDIPLLRASCPR